VQVWLPDGTRKERTGWRCEAISERHRMWGFNCPAVDLDFVMAEFNHGLPVALIEYKERHATQPHLMSPTYRALTALANGYGGGPLPFFIVFYDPVEWWFRVVPVNEPAYSHYRHVLNELITEQRFVRSLYLLRKKTLSLEDEEVIRRLSTTLPEAPSA